MIAYTVMFLIAVYLNLKDTRALLMALVVGLSYFFPFELISSRDAWYIACVASELIVILFCTWLRSKSSLAIAGLCIMLLASHFIAYHNIQLQVYSLVAKYLEYVQIVSCILLSHPILNYLKERIKCR
jgi:hypothetical protein